MTVVVPNRRVYSAEYLHKLRGSSSQPKLCEAIEERDGEDAELVKGRFKTAGRTHGCWRRSTTLSVTKHPAALQLSLTTLFLSFRVTHCRNAFRAVA